MKRDLTILKSMALHSRALKLMPGGVSSNARLWHRLCPVITPCTIFVHRAEGSHIWDVDGNEYIDYRLGFGPVILGHSYPAVHARVHEVDEKGIVFALDHELEVTVTEKIQHIVPNAEMVRYSNSGTEATMHAIRVARGFTGKEKILKFEGHYHGAHDYLLFSTEPPFADGQVVPQPSSRGIPEAIKNLVLVEQWNNFESVEKTLKKNADSLAAVILEPVMGNAAVIPPKKGFLDFLRKLTRELNIVLIFDEVKTGFRLAPGGAQQIFKVTADLATFAKSLGNGYPISMIAGKKEIMETIGPKKVTHGGTYASNPISLAAADATLNEFKTKKIHDRINSFGENLMKGLKDVLDDAEIHGIIQGFPGMFQMLFTERDEITTYQDLRHCDFGFFSRVQYELLRNGVMIDEDNGEPMFTCYSHSNTDLKKTLESFQASLEASKKVTSYPQPSRFISI